MPKILSGLKYLLALYLMYAGIDTMFGPVADSSDLGLVYETRFTLVIFGIIFFTSGAVLLLGKIFKRMRVIGWGLYAIFLCFLFATILNWVGLGTSHAVGNLVMSILVGLLYLRWKRLYREQQVLDTPHDVVIGLEPDVEHPKRRA